MQVPGLVALNQTQDAISGSTFDEWLESAGQRWQSAQRTQVRDAWTWMHEIGQGDAARDRGLPVARILSELLADHEVVIAALVVPAARAGAADREGMAARIGEAATRLVEGVRQLDMIGELHQQQGRSDGQQLEALRKMLLAMAQDVRVVLVRLAMRLHTMRCLRDRPSAEQVRVARETQDIFAPLANRLGIGRIKWELEDLALRYLDPATYRTLARTLDERRADRERYISGVLELLRAELRQAGIHAEVSGRVKHLYSIWRKMQRKRLPIEQIFDIRAVRIMVDSVADCYAALGVVHGLWNHIRREFDDYIANPKPNGYQSLHTAVVGPEGRTLEVQIRTHKMHQDAELGVAAHWRYKEGGAGTADAGLRQVNWLRQVLEWKDEEAEDESDFLDRFKAEALSDRVYVLTPKGAVVELPQGATPLDFAYHVHTEVGHRCRGAKVNGRIVPLTWELHNGEQVDILTGKTPAPSRDWLSPHLGYLRTGRARAKVRQWFKQLDLDKNLAAGRQALERELARLDVSLRQVDWLPVAQKFNFARNEELFAAVGRGDLAVRQVIARLQEQILPPQPAEEQLPLSRPWLEDGGGEIRIRGVGKLLTQMATCCKPVPPDPISGYITRGRGVAIHRQDCSNLAHLASRHPERLIEVDWGEEAERRYQVDVMVEAYDRPGLIRDISGVLANERVNVMAMNTRTDARDDVARMEMTLTIADVEQLSRILDRVARLPNVVSARRRR